MKSFRKVSYPGLQIVVSDNASNDGSQGMVRVEFPEVVLLTREKGVGYNARNSLYLLKRQRVGWYPLAL